VGSEVSITEWRGVALAHPDLLTEDSLWAAQSSFDEVGGKAGEIIPQQSTPLGLRGIGSQTAGGTVTMRVQSPGFGGPTNRLSLIRKADTSTEFGGWNPPATIQQTRSVAWQGVTSQAQTYPTLAVDSEGYAVAVSYKNYSGTSYAIQSHTLNPDTKTWGSAVNVHNYGTSAPLYPGRASVHLMDDNTFQCVVLVFDSTNSTVNFRVYRSKDRGASWDLVSRYALDVPLDGSALTTGFTFQNPDRLRTCCNPKTGDVLALLEVECTNTAKTHGTRTLQFYSVDGGLTYKTVISVEDSITDATVADLQYTAADVAPYRDGFAVSMAVGVTGVTALRVYRLAHGFIRYVDAPSTDVVTAAYDVLSDAGANPDYVDDSESTMWRDDAGIYYLMVTAISLTTQPTAIFRSRDSLQTWEGVGEGDRLTTAGQDSGQLWDAAATSRPTRFCARAHRGGALWLHNCDSSGNTDNDLFATRLGGWSSVVMPSLGLTDYDTSRVTWLRTGLAFDFPDAGVWTKTTSGGTAALIQGPDVNVSTTGQTLYWYNAYQGATTEGVIAHFTVRVNSGGTVAADEVGIRIKCSGGTTTEYDVSLRLSTTQARLVDNVAGASIGLVALDLDGFHYTFRMALENDDVKVWYRIDDFGDDQEFTELASSTSLTARTLGAGGTNDIRFGHIGTTTSDSDWREWHFTSDQYTGRQCATQVNPDDLVGRPVGGQDFPIYTIDGLYVTAIGGPGREGDEFIAYAGASHPWQNMLPMVSASPSEGFRGGQVLSGASPAQTFAFYAQSDLTASGSESQWPTDILVVDMRGLNGRDYRIEKYASGAWSTLADVNTVVASGAMTRAGNTVAFSGGVASATNRYIPPDALTGGTVKMSGTPALFKIAGNESGFMQPPANTKAAVLRIDGATTSSPTFYSSAEVWSPNLCVVINLKGADLAAVRVSLLSQETADLDLRAGTMFVGYGVPLREYSNGWTWNVEANSDIKEQQSGSRRGIQNGPTRRVVELAWIDPVNTSPINGAGASPNFSEASGNSGALPVLVEGETPYRIAGITDQTAGGVIPGILLPRVDYVANGSSDVQVFRLPYDTVYGRMTGRTRLEHVTGNEGNGPGDSYIGQVYRVARMIVEEET
jgi:hypothetical protein